MEPIDLPIYKERLRDTEIEGREGGINFKKLTYFS